MDEASKKEKRGKVKDSLLKDRAEGSDEVKG